MAQQIKESPACLGTIHCYHSFAFTLVQYWNGLYKCNVLVQIPLLPSLAHLYSADADRLHVQLQVFLGTFLPLLQFVACRDLNHVHHIIIQRLYHTLGQLEWFYKIIMVQPTRCRNIFQ